MALTASTSAQRAASRAGQSRRRTVVCRASAERPAGRRLILGAGLAVALVSLPMNDAAKAGVPITPDALLNRKGEIYHTEEEWQQILGPAYSVMRGEGTELPFTSPLNNEKRDGTFVCAGCDTPLFLSSTKYNSGTGWPSFYDVIPGTVDTAPDFKLFYPRTEVRCHKCQGHLGHVFDDGPRPTGKRYCMNGICLKFVPKDA